MKITRQDAWTKDEDVILAETVLRYIREGKTQLDAFKKVAKKLSRTPAACGFRWNATVRKQYNGAITAAKKDRKSDYLSINSNAQSNVRISESELHPNVREAISLLTTLNNTSQLSNSASVVSNDYIISKLQAENEQLQIKINRYEAVWKEMGKLWKWIRKMEDK